MPIRICQLITELRPAGAERCVYELATRLDRGRFEVQVAALQGGGVADRLTAAGVKVTVLGVRGKWDVGKLGGLKKLLRRERIDVLHTHLFHADLAGRLAARSAGVPHLVHTVHVAEARWRPWQYAFARWTAGRCDKIIAVSAAVAEHHGRLARLTAEHYAVIPNGIDVAAYERDEAARSRLRAQWGVGAGTILAAFVGRLDPQKGIDVLLAAAAASASQGLQFVLAGDGPQRPLVEQFIAKNPAGRFVRMLGHVDGVRDVLSAADLFVMPSRWEGFGLAAAEAMAAGLPVIARDVPGLHEVLDAGSAGVLIPADDPAALAAAIGRLGADASLRASLAAAGRQRVQREYRIETCIQRHEALYLSLLGGQPS